MELAAVREAARAAEAAAAAAMTNLVLAAGINSPDERAGESAGLCDWSLAFGGR